MSVVIETTKGIFTVDLYTEQRPKTCKNFLKLCKVKFYNFSLFHSVQTNFIAQTGDPTGIGKNGGESIYRRLYGDQATFYEGELLPKIKHSKKGQVSMVSVGDNLFGSQFFITLDDDLDYLDGTHCVFGEIVEGLDEILTAFNETICDEEHRPYQDIRIAHTVILDDPYEDPTGLEIPDRSPPPSKEMMASTRIGADEDLDDFDGMDDREISEMLAEKEARAQATILEMIGDLPEADVAPPENVLFVCKLNPVTTDDDLEIIFSRFGKVKTCEVIRDRKSGDSLQYAFVEFEDPKSCESAYFKMDNVLIDDRRIHVDFSQSVSKYQWKGRGRLEIVGEGKQNDNRGRQERPKDAGRPKDSERPKQRDYPKDNRSFDRRDDRQERERFERRRDDTRDRQNVRKPEERFDRKRESSKERRRDGSRDRKNVRGDYENFRRKEEMKVRQRDDSRDRQKPSRDHKYVDDRREKSKDRRREDSRKERRDDSNDRKKDRKKKKDRHSEKSDSDLSSSDEKDYSRKKKKEKKEKRRRSRSVSRERNHHSKKHRN